MTLTTESIYNNLVRKHLTSVVGSTSIFLLLLHSQYIADEQRIVLRILWHATTKSKSVSWHISPTSAISDCLWLVQTNIAYALYMSPCHNLALPYTASRYDGIYHCTSTFFQYQLYIPHSLVVRIAWSLLSQFPIMPHD